jgi:hypothetical protein
MTGKMNWAKVGTTRRIQRYGHEPIAYGDPNLTAVWPNAKEANAKPKAAKRVRKADDVEARALAAAKLRDQQILAATKHAERAKRKKEAAAKAAIQRQQIADAAKLAAERRKANYQKRLDAMTIAERAAYEFEKARQDDVRLRGVVVEHCAMPKAKALRKSGKQP